MEVFTLSPDPGTGMVTIIERVRIISKEGDNAEVNLLEGMTMFELQIWLQEKTGMAWEPRADGDSHIRFNGMNFDMDIDERLPARGVSHKPRHPHKYRREGRPEGPGPAAPRRPFRIGRVKVVSNMGTLYDTSSEEGYLIMIWKHQH